MSLRRPVFLLVFAAALVGAGMWLVLGGDEARWGVPGDSHPLIAMPPAPVPAPAPAAPLPEVLVELVPTARLQRLVAPPLPSAAAAAIECRWVAGAAAVLSTRLPAPGPQLLRIGSTAAPIYRVIAVGDASSPELPPRPADCAFAGKVVDETGAPVVGAQAWLGGTAATSDDDGIFRCNGMSGGRGVPLVLRAAGRASSFAVVDVEPVPAPTPAVFVLEAGAAVEVQFAGRLPGGRPARVLVLPGVALDSRVQRFPFFLQGEAAPDNAGVELDAQGRCRLEGLPLDTELRIVVLQPLLAASPVTVRLRRPMQSVTVSGRLLPELNGTVVDDEGAALGSVVVSSRPRLASAPDFGAQWLLPPAAYTLGASVATTGADGRFSVGCHEGKSGSLVELRAAGRFGLQVTASGGVAERTFTLPRETAEAGPPELHLVADRPARLRLREGDHTHPGALWSGLVYVLPWREAVLADVLVTVVPGGGGQQRQTAHRNVIVAGRTELRIDVDP